MAAAKAVPSLPTPNSQRRKLNELTQSLHLLKVSSRHQRTQAALRTAESAPPAGSGTTGKPAQRGSLPPLLDAATQQTAASHTPRSRSASPEVDPPATSTQASAGATAAPKAGSNCGDGRRGATPPTEASTAAAAAGSRDTELAAAYQMLDAALADKDVLAGQLHAVRAALTVEHAAREQERAELEQAKAQLEAARQEQKVCWAAAGACGGGSRMRQRARRSAHVRPVCRSSRAHSPMHPITGGGVDGAGGRAEGEAACSRAAGGPASSGQCRGSGGRRGGTVRRGGKGSGGRPEGRQQRRQGAGSRAGGGQGRRRGATRSSRRRREHARRSHGEQPQRAAVERAAVALSASCCNYPDPPSMQGVCEAVRRHCCFADYIWVVACLPPVQHESLRPGHPPGPCKASGGNLPVLRAAAGASPPCGEGAERLWALAGYGGARNSTCSAKPKMVARWTALRLARGPDPAPAVTHGCRPCSGLQCLLATCRSTLGAVGAAAANLHGPPALWRSAWPCCWSARTPTPAANVSSARRRVL